MRLWRPATGIVDGVREPAVAGSFYPGGAQALADAVDGHVAVAAQVLRDREAEAAASRRRPASPPLSRGAHTVAVVAPHAGYVYSGPTAGFSYAAVHSDAVERVVLLGPAHHVPVMGIGLSTALAWRTPLGDVPLDREAGEHLEREFEGVVTADGAHGPEHSLEVQVPFLQRVLPEGWRLVPLIVGADLPDHVAAVVTWAAQQPRTLVVVSTDLSHYLSYEAAIAQDGRTIRAVLHRHADGIGMMDACGRYPLRGLLTAAAARSWTVRLLDSRNSGDTAGDRDRVVGYASFLVTSEEVAADTSAEVATSGRSGTASGRISPESVASPILPDSGGEAPPELSAGAPGSESSAARVPPESSGELLSDQARAALLQVARRTIEEALVSGRRPAFDEEAWRGADPDLTKPGAAFVTLRSSDGRLLGCIGSLSARQALVADVAEHAYDAAFRDPRFPPLTPEQARDMVVDVSVLSATRPFPCDSFDELRSRLEPGTGLVVHAGRHRATFLPAVWEQLPEAGPFLDALWRKAGMTPGEWPRGTTIEVYGSQEFAER